MSKMEEREQGYEAQFVHDHERAFKAKARRNRLLAMWAAEHLGLVGIAADNYASDMVASDFEQPDSVVIDKVAQDFAKAGVAIGAPQIADQLHRCAAEAKQQMLKR
jgi:hypothetical protein